MPTPYDCFSVEKILHTPQLEKKPAKDVSLKPIEILSILEGEDTPPTNHLQLLRICLLACLLPCWLDGCK
jgi:hypothetical protein